MKHGKTMYYIKSCRLDVIDRLFVPNVFPLGNHYDYKEFPLRTLLKILFCNRMITHKWINKGLKKLAILFEAQILAFKNSHFKNGKKKRLHRSWGSAKCLWGRHSLDFNHCKRYQKIVIFLNIKSVQRILHYGLWWCLVAKFNRLDHFGHFCHDCDFADSNYHILSLFLLKLLSNPISTYCIFALNIRLFTFFQWCLVSLQMGI